MKQQLIPATIKMNRKPDQKTNIFSRRKASASWRVLAFILIFSVFLPLNKTQAAVWPAIDPIIRTGLDTIKKALEDMLLGIGKQIAAEALNGRLNIMVGGSSTKNAKFIVDWKDYLIDEPQKQTRLYLTAHIDKATSGRGSLSQYIPAGSEGFGLAGGSYINSLKVGVQNTVINPATPKVTYIGNPSQMFAQGNFRNLSLYLSGINNPWAFNLHIQEQYDKKAEEEKTIAASKSAANQGFIGTEQNGKTLSPGILIKENMANVQDLGNKIIANAKGIPELITSVVTQMITKSVQQGIGSIQASINKETQKVQAGTSTQMNAAVQQMGPGAQYAQKWMLNASKK